MSDLSFQIRHDWFTPAAWERNILPLCMSMTDEGGCIAVLLQVDPKQRNFTLASAHSFDPKERKVLRQAIARCRERKDAAQHAAPVRTSCEVANNAEIAIERGGATP